MSVLQIVQVAALALWMAGSLFVNLILGPAVFLMISNRDEAEAAHSNALLWLHRLGYAAAALFLSAGVWEHSVFAVATHPSSWTVSLMVILAAVASRRFLPRKGALREELGSVSSTPGHDPRRVEFDRLGRWVVQGEIAVLLLGLLSVILTIRGSR
jgi:hypothetical protein